MRDALFEHWYTQNLDPVKLVAKIFKDENGKTLPRTVIVQYKTFYRRKAQIFPSELKPRRS
ncbi:hypothetical protein PHMEG_0007844 [Phytophthora megakarya]|uniref:RxLR effector protein n=1 Tax=Phytophthora megakarya TaxID=4795 RepID=A0A225WMK3_9STRA|nr:hypothetical protein PHMEG_0007844 [Phytophthora megakarya]